MNQSAAIRDLITSSLQESRDNTRAGRHVQNLRGAGDTQLEELLRYILHPADLPGAPGPETSHHGQIKNSPHSPLSSFLPGVLSQRHQLILDLVGVQRGHDRSGQDFLLSLEF